MEHNFESDKSRKNRKWYVWLFIALLGALLISGLASDTLLGMFSALLGGITPILIGFVIAYILIGPVNLIEKKLLKNAFVGNPHAKSLKRAISLTICYVIIIGLILALLLLVIPSMVELIQNITKDGDSYLQTIQVSITNLLSSLPWFSDAEASSIVDGAAQSIFESIKNMLPAFLSNLMTFLMDTATIVFNIIMGLFISFLLVKDKELIAHTCKRYTYAYYDKKKADEILTITRRSYKSLNQCMLCNIIVMAIIFVLAWIGYAIIDVPYAVLIALLLGVLSVIPYIGGFLAMIPLVLVMLVMSTIDLTLILIAVIFTLLLWAIVTTFVPPYIISKRLNVRAIVNVVTLIIGGALFGVVGMLLTGPAVAVITVIMQEKLETRESAREREELVEAGLATIDEVGVSDLLDLTQDEDVTLFVPKEDRSFLTKKRRKSKKEEEKKSETKIDI
ncbi:MAG: AI-2E family transporter [Clostridia bacterium]|nr:AI-2E family transporter [Clostridia bacterium]